MEYTPSKNSIKFMSKLNWKELIPYVKKIYGQEYTKMLIAHLESYKNK